MRVCPMLLFPAWAGVAGTGSETLDRGITAMRADGQGISRSAVILYGRWPEGLARNPVFLLSSRRSRAEAAGGPALPSRKESWT